MLAALQQDSGYQYRASFGTRVLSAVLALGIIALMILALMRLGVLPPIAEKPEVKSTTFVLTPEPKTANHTRSAVQTRHVTSGGAPRKLAPVAKAPPTPKAPVPWNVTPLTQQEFAASDISKLPSHEVAGPKVGEGGEGTGSAHGSGDSEVAGGQGPGGETLYKVDWYRHPTGQELDFYKPKTDTGSGWGEIACRTIDHYHVDDCIELGESPGSGRARQVKEAAWQFLVRPPRVGDRPLIGGWVAIRIDFSERNAP